MKTEDIIKRLDELKLSSNKVDLSNLKEINQSISGLKNAEKDAEKVVGKYNTKFDEAVRAWRVMNNERNAIHGWAFSHAPAVIRDFEKNAKQLGVDVNGVSEVKELKKLISKGKEIVKLMDKIKEPKD